MIGWSFEEALAVDTREVVTGWWARRRPSAAEGVLTLVPATPGQMVDATGAGDAFGGAYAACRLLGHAPVEAVRRAAATAALVITTRGADVALTLDPKESSILPTVEDLDS